jgi:hypothetical protein
MNADSSDYENFNDASRSEPLKGPVDIAASSANPFREPLPQEAVDPFRVVSKRRSRASGFDYQGFRALCDNLYAEAQELQRVASHEDFGSSTDGFALELGALLDELYDFEAMPEPDLCIVTSKRGDQSLMKQRFGRSRAAEFCRDSMSRCDWHDQQTGGSHDA